MLYKSYSSLGQSLMFRSLNKCPSKRWNSLMNLNQLNRQWTYSSISERIEEACQQEIPLFSVQSKNLSNYSKSNHKIYREAVVDDNHLSIMVIHQPIKRYLIARCEQPSLTMTHHLKTDTSLMLQIFSGAQQVFLISQQLIRCHLIQQVNRNHNKICRLTKEQPKN